MFGVAFIPHVSRLATSSADGTFRLWDLRSAKEALSFRTAMNLGIDFSPDGQRLAMALGDGTIRIVSAAPIEGVTAWGPLLDIRHAGYVSGYSSDGTRLNTVEDGHGGGERGHLRVRSAADGRILLDVKGIDVPHWAGGAFSPDGARLAVLDRDGSTRLLDATTGQVLRTLGKVKAHVPSVAYSPDGRWIAAKDEETGRTTKVVIWDAKTGRLARSLDAGAYSLEKFVFSPDGRRFAATSNDLRVRVWDAETGRKLWIALAHFGSIRALAFSPDGKQIATGHVGEASLKIWDSTTGQPISALPGHPGLVQCVAYSPDGRFLASGSTDRTVRIWAVATGQEIRTLVDHTDWITGVAFSPDGSRLASSSFDGTIKIWDLTRLSPGLANHP
jgi:WD40 repeat protein